LIQTEASFQYACKLISSKAFVKRWKINSRSIPYNKPVSDIIKRLFWN